MKNTRSNKFDYFTGNNTPEKQKKNLAKQVWKWLKMVLYVLIFGVTLTGCVQNFVVTTSGTSGNGVEFYLDRNDISPHVTTLTKNESSASTLAARIAANAETPRTLSSTDPAINTEIPALPRISEDKGINFHLDDKALIEKLRKQAIQSGSEYGRYGGLSSSIRLIQGDKQITADPNGGDIYSKSGRYIFKTDIQESYTPVTEFKPIYGLAVPVTTGVNAKTGLLDFVQLPYFGINSDNTDKITFVSGLSVIPTKFTVLTESGEVDKVRLANQIYARDLLQLLYNETFTDPKWTTVFDGKTPGDFFKTEIIDKFAAAPSGTTPDVTVTALQRAVLSEYMTVLDRYATDLGFFKNPIFQNEQNKYSELNSATFGYSAQASLVYTGDQAQKPITSWGEAWELGPFYGFVVYPLAWITQSIRQLFPNLAGWGSVFAILIAVILVKLLTLAITFKSIVGQSIQEDLRGKKAQIEAKYEGFEKNKTMKLRKQQDLQALYKKHNIKPFDLILTVIISTPIFLAMWRIVQGIPEIKSTSWLGINFSSTSYSNLFAGQYQYLWIMTVAVIIQFSSQVLPRFLNRKKLKHRISIAENQALKKSEKTQRLVTIFVVGISLFFSAGVQVYWSISGLFTILQALGIHKLKKTTWWRTKYSLKFK